MQKFRRRPAVCSGSATSWRINCAQRSSSVGSYRTWRNGLITTLRRRVAVQLEQVEASWRPRIVRPTRVAARFGRTSRGNSEQGLHVADWVREAVRHPALRRYKARRARTGRRRRRWSAEAVSGPASAKPYRFEVHDSHDIRPLTSPDRLHGFEQLARQLGRLAKAGARLASPSSFQPLPTPNRKRPPEIL